MYEGIGSERLSLSSYNFVVVIVVVVVVVLF